MNFNLISYVFSIKNLCTKYSNKKYFLNKFREIDQLNILIIFFLSFILHSDEILTVKNKENTPQSLKQSVSLNKNLVILI